MCGLVSTWRDHRGRSAPMPLDFPRITSIVRHLQFRTERMFSFLASLIMVVPVGETFACTPTAVWDGDGPIWCAEGPRIRLSGIAARELDGTCSPGHPCPEADPYDARDALVRLLGSASGSGLHGHVRVSGPRLSCISTGGAGGNRTGAWCTSPVSGDISCAMIEGGWALRWNRYWGDHQCP